MDNYLVPVEKIIKMDKNILNLADRLRRLYHKYEGNRCFVMGNGPSLNQMNLERLKNEYVWSANRCFLLFDRLNWRPTFYVAVDQRVIQNSLNDIKQLIKNLPKTIFFFPGWCLEKGYLSSKNNVYLFNEDKSGSDAHFSFDVAEKVACLSTVIVTSLQLAVYLGFNPVYLIGVDLSYSINKIDNNVAEFIASPGMDKDHFDSRYLDKGEKWQIPDVERMKMDLRMARQSIESLGVTIFNATVGGSLADFQRINYENIFTSPLKERPGLPE